MSDRIQAYKDLWTKVDNYVLVEIPHKYEDLRTIHTHLVYIVHPTGYVEQGLMPQDAQIVVDRMLEAGVQVLTQEQIKYANQVHRLWTDKADEYYLVRLEHEDEAYGIFNKRCADFVKFHTWDMNWDEITQKMKHAGVEIISEKDSLRLREQNLKAT